MRTKHIPAILCSKETELLQKNNIKWAQRFYKALSIYFSPYTSFCETIGTHMLESNKNSESLTCKDLDYREVSTPWSLRTKKEL